MKINCENKLDENGNILPMKTTIFGREFTIQLLKKEVDIYECILCGYSIMPGQYPYMVRHMKKFHSEIQMPDTKKSKAAKVLTEKALVISNFFELKTVIETVWVCPVCGEEKLYNNWRKREKEKNGTRFYMTDNKWVRIWAHMTKHFKEFRKYYVPPVR